VKKLWFDATAWNLNLPGIEKFRMVTLSSCESEFAAHVIDIPGNWILFRATKFDLL